MFNKFFISCGVKEYHLTKVFNDWEFIEEDLRSFYKDIVPEKYAKNDQFLKHSLFYIYCDGYSRLLPGKNEQFVREIEYLLYYLIYLYLLENKVDVAEMFIDAIDFFENKGKKIVVNRKCSIETRRLLSAYSFTHVPHYKDILEDLKRLDAKGLNNLNLIGFVELKSISKRNSIDAYHSDQVNNAVIDMDKIRELRELIRKNVFPDIFIEFFNLLDKKFWR